MKGSLRTHGALHKVCANVSGFANPTNEDLPRCQARPFSVRLAAPGEKDEMRSCMPCSWILYSMMMCSLDRCQV